MKVHVDKVSRRQLTRTPTDSMAPFVQAAVLRPLERPPSTGSVKPIISSVGTLPVDGPRWNVQHPSLRGATPAPVASAWPAIRIATLCAPRRK